MFTLRLPPLAYPWFAPRGAAAVSPRSAYASANVVGADEPVN